MELGCLVSIGTGKTTPQPVDPSEIEMSSMVGMMKGMRNLLNMIMVQVSCYQHFCWLNVLPGDCSTF